MTTTHLERYAAAADPFGALVAKINDWSAPSPCEGWTARDVLGHVIETQRDFLAGQGYPSPAPDLGDPARAWAGHDAWVRGLLADAATAGQRYEGHFGPTTVGDTMVDFYGWDLLVHRWDLARAAGQEVEFSDAELDTVEGAAEGFGDMLYADGICAPALDVPADASRQSKVLARLGRRG